MNCKYCGKYCGKDLGSDASGSECPRCRNNIYKNEIECINEMIIELKKIMERQEEIKKKIFGE